MNEPFDVAIVGAGILGLAHAYQFAKRGQRVVVLERSPKAEGASVRNFGMVWPIGQPLGTSHDMAQRSRDHWATVLADAGIWHDPCGSLQLCYHDDETAVVQEFLTRPDEAVRGCEWLDAKAVQACSPHVNPVGLQGGMFSPREINVDPRDVIAKLPTYLADRFGVTFRFGTQALGYDGDTVRTSAGLVPAKRFVVCGGDDFRTLYPEAFAGTGIYRCKLQMLRTKPFGQDFRFGPMLAAGLTLLHYKAFASCAALPDVRRRMERDFPEHLAYGIHVMASRTESGELTLGDSHEYGDAMDPFDKPHIDDLILQYLASFLKLEVPIASRWHGYYAKHPSATTFVVEPAPNVTIATAVGGAGMTLSFGLADAVVSRSFGESA